MVGKSKTRVKVNKLKVNKETVKDLTKEERKKVKGGARRDNGLTIVHSRLCNPPNQNCQCSS